MTRKDFLNILIKSTILIWIVKYFKILFVDEPKHTEQQIYYMTCTGQFTYQIKNYYNYEPIVIINCKKQFNHNINRNTKPLKSRYVAPLKRKDYYNKV